MQIPDLTGLVNLLTKIAMGLTSIMTWLFGNMYLTVLLLVFVGGFYFYYKYGRKRG